MAVDITLMWRQLHRFVLFLLVYFRDSDHSEYIAASYINEAGIFISLQKVGSGLLHDELWFD